MSNVSGLSSYFTSLISNLMELEAQPLYTLQARQKLLNTQKADYSSVKTELNELKSSVKSLISSSPLTALKAGRAVKVADTQDEKKVATATSSSYAVAGDYNLNVTNLAKAQQRISAEQSSMDLALGKTGTFWLGGSGTASVSTTTNESVAGVTTGTVSNSMTELGTAAYTVEMREINGVLKFRLKDADDQAMAIDDLSKTDSSKTTNWQTVTEGAMDTGRGLVLTFGANAVAGDTTVDYTAAGVAVEIEANDSLIDIGNKINESSQPEGHAVVASVVGKNLVLTAAETGLNHRMVYNDGVGLGLSNDLVSDSADTVKALDAHFTVNNIAFTRSTNSGLTDVIAGVTLNLANDAEGQTATIQVDNDLSGAKSAIESFVSEFNSLQTFLSEKTSVTNDGKGNYTRGSLADDTIFSELRMSMFSTFLKSVEGAGDYRSLRDIGIEIDDNLKVSIADAGLLEEALTNNLEEVGTLMESIMTEMETTLSRYTETGGYIEGTLQSIDFDVTDVKNDLEDENERLSDREASLTLQYAELQSQLYTMQYLQQMMSTLNSSSMGSSKSFYG